MPFLVRESDDIRKWFLSWWHGHTAGHVKWDTQNRTRTHVCMYKNTIPLLSKSMRAHTTAYMCVFCWQICLFCPTFYHGGFVDLRSIICLPRCFWIYKVFVYLVKSQILPRGGIVKLLIFEKNGNSHSYLPFTTPQWCWGFNTRYFLLPYGNGGMYMQHAEETYRVPRII